MNLKTFFKCNGLFQGHYIEEKNIAKIFLMFKQSVLLRVKHACSAMLREYQRVF